jgi:PT repeat
MEDEDVELKLEDTRLPSDAAHDRTRTRTCRRRMSMCVVLSLMVVCVAIAGVVVYQQKIMNNTNSTVSGIQDGGGGPDITQAPSMSPSPSASPTRNPNTSSQSMTEEPSALPTSQPTGQPTDQPTGQPTEFTATPSVISSATDTTVISSVTEMPTALDENSASVPVSESSSSVPSSAAQVYSTVAPTLSIVSTPGPSPNEVTGTKSPTLSPTYSLKDYTS